MKSLTLLLSIVISSVLFSQSDTSDTFGLPELRIFQKEKGKNVTYVFDNSLNKFTLTPTFLLPDTNRYIYKVRLADINQISFVNGTHALNAAGITGAVGFGMGFLLFGAISTLFSSEEVFSVSFAFLGGLVTAVPAAVIGLVFGALSPKYEEYSFPGFSDQKKYETLKKLLKKYNQKR